MVRRNRSSRRKTRSAGVRAGRTYKNLVGTRAEVMHGTAFKTSYGRTKSQGGDALTKRDLKYNKQGRIVSIMKSKKGPQLLKQLRDAGYTTKKGKFGAIKTAKKGRKSPKSRKAKRKTKRCRHKTGRKKGKYKKC